MIIKASAEDVGAIMLALPPEARLPDSGFLYDGESELTVPEPFAAAVTALTTGPRWRQRLSEAALDAAREAAADRALAAIASISAPILAAYTPAERASWDAQAAEARAVKAGATAAGAPLLAMLAQARGVALAEMADLVIRQAGQFMQVAATEQLLRRQAEAAIAAAKDAAAIEAAVEAVTEGVGRARAAMAAG